MKYSPSLLLLIIIKGRFLLPVWGVEKLEFPLKPHPFQAAPLSVANIHQHKQPLPGWDEQDGKFHVATIVQAGARLRGRAWGPTPVSEESCPWGSARLSQAADCALSFCFKLLSSPLRCREGSRMQAGYTQDRRQGIILPVLQLQGTIINVHQCIRCTEGTRQQGTNSEQICSSKK